MGGQDNADTLSEDSAHLPTVSVFVILLAIMAALTASTKPSTERFAAAKVSIIESFSGAISNAQPQRLALSASLSDSLQLLCAEYNADCQSVLAENVDGVAILFGETAFDATGGGLTALEQTFLRALAKVVAPSASKLTMLLPMERPLNAPQASIVVDLLQRFSGRKIKISFAQVPSLQSVPHFGFLILPQDAQL